MFGIGAVTRVYLAAGAPICARDSKAYTALFE
jgi:hypothetical protein